MSSSENYVVFTELIDILMVDMCPDKIKGSLAYRILHFLQVISIAHFVTINQ